MRKLFHLVLLCIAAAALALPSVAAPLPPAVGQKAPDFELTDVMGKKVRLSSVVSTGPVVLVVLRGYPGYTCPFCTKQVHDYVQHAGDFEQAGYHVVFVYPGPPSGLDSHAKEFLADAQFPDSFKMLLDPGYSFTNAYGLRWDAPHETAYPSTFLLNQDGEVFFSMSGRTHNGRSTAAEILAAIPPKKGN
jgi:peroxiredoxin